MTDDRLPLTERSYGSFKRQLTLPADVDPDAIVAKYAKGKAANRVRKIAIG
jgi:HSP20 family molecular chaperone IbpA